MIRCRTLVLLSSTIERYLGSSSRVSANEPPHSKTKVIRSNRCALIYIHRSKDRTSGPGEGLNVDLQVIKKINGASVAHCHVVQQKALRFPLDHLRVDPVNIVTPITECQALNI